MSALPPIHWPRGLPEPDPDSQAHSRRVQAALHQAIRAADGWLPFEAWMQAALYAPGLGYYSAGSTKLHREGDFTTAPELSPLYGQTLATQVAEILRASGTPTVLEFGAGSGALAEALIPALVAQGLSPDYEILEVSADLRARQQARLAGLAPRIRWRDTLPESFTGCVIANEVLDAMPAHLVQWGADGILEVLGVMQDDSPESLAGFRWAARPAPAALQAQARDCLPPVPGYRSELHPQAIAWVRALGDWLQRGAALLIDYGFPRAEYYHPQRAQGTLMCHFRHHAHDQPLILPGIQDITTHVDFTAVADAALAGGLDVLGYTSQARFLMNSGLLERLQAMGTDGPAQRQALSAVNTLLSEAEMGELFKVMAIGRGLTPPLIGFSRGDRRDRL